MIYIHETNSGILASSFSEYNLSIFDAFDGENETYSGHFDWQSWQSRFKNLITSAFIIVIPVEDDLDDKVETYSGSPDLRFLSLSVQSLIIPAWGDVGQVEDEKVADEARRILSIIAETILIFQKRAVDLEHLPQLHAFDVQDGSILIEWIFDDFRVGFSIEPILSESSWYLVSNAKLGDIGKSGHISQDESETQNLILSLLNFVMSHV